MDDVFQVVVPRGSVQFLRPYAHSRATSHTASSTTRVHTTAAHTATGRRGPPAALGMVIRALKTRACLVQAVFAKDALALPSAGSLVAGVRCARSQCRYRVQTPIAVTGGCFK